MYGSVIRYKSNPLFQFRVIFTVKLVPTTYLTHFHGRLSRVIGENMLLVPTQAFAAVVVQPNKSIDDEHKSQLDYMLHWIQLPLFDSSYDPYPFNIQLFHCWIYFTVSLWFTLSQHCFNAKSHNSLANHYIIRQEYEEGRTGRTHRATAISSSFVMNFGMGGTWDMRKIMSNLISPVLYVIRSCIFNWFDSVWLNSKYAPVY